VAFPMFTFFKKKTDVLNHWIAFADGFQSSPTEFYTALESELAARQIPSMAMSKIEFPEGGLLSDKRIYLRMLRERLVFDVCAAPFGNSFFFSCRTAEIPVSLKLWELILILLVGSCCLPFLIIIIYYITGSILLTIFAVALVPFTALGIFFMRDEVASGLEDIDASLIKIPVIGTIYEVFFRKETYHRIDSRLCYLESVPTIVKQLAEATTAAKGLKLIRQYELAPVLGELYKSRSPGGPADAPAIPAPPIL